MITRNSRGQYFQHGIGGTYPVNDRDPQNDVDFDEDQWRDERDNDLDRMIEHLEDE
jgi:hypothetical protein